MVKKWQIWLKKVFGRVSSKEDLVHVQQKFICDHHLNERDRRENARALQEVTAGE